MSYDILILIGLTFVPFLELRASIPYGIIATDLHWSVVFIVCVLANMVLGPMVYFFIDNLLGVILRWKFFEKMYLWYIARVQKRIKKPIDKYGKFGLAVFIGFPLPGSGSYSGSIAAHLMGLKFKKFLYANTLGVLMAGIIVTVIMLTGSTAFQIFIKDIL
ncbi:COG2426 family protein [Nanoarchaeota archaeon]